MSDGASIRTNKSVSSLLKKFSRKRTSKPSSKSKFFETTQRSREPESAPTTRTTTKMQVKDDIAKKDEDKKDEEDKKNEQIEQERKETEKASGPEVPNFDRTASTVEKKGVQPGSAPWTQVGVKGVFASIWEHEETDLFRDKVYSDNSYWTPNARSLWESLRVSHQILSNNEHLRWVNRDYMSFPTTLYYAVMYYIRILQVREYFNENSDSESKFYRRFERTFKLNQLPVAGFLIPFFSAIAGYEPGDSRLTWVLPNYNWIFRGHDQDFVTDYRIDLNASVFVNPDIPLLYDYWKVYCSTDNLVNRYKEKGTFVPKHTNDAAFVLGYYRMNTGASTVNMARALGGWGIDTPHPESFEKYQESAGYWRDSKFRTRGPAFGTAADAAITNIAYFLRMEDTFAWFEECIDSALEHSKYFSGGKFFSDIDPIGGAELGIRGTLTSTSDLQIRTGAHWTWFPGHVQGWTGGLSWYEPEIHDYHKLNFRHTMTCCSVAVTWSTHDGTNRANHVEVFAPVLAAGNAMARWGPWFDFTKAGAAMAHRTIGLHGSSAIDFEVFDRRRNLLRNRFYLGKPSDQ